jgi:CheY-like chemotaxis protein
VLKDKWALVVEDDAHSLVAISSILRDLGIRFKRNTTGANVVSQLRAMTPLPDFILIDTDLSGGDAFVILRQMQATGETAAIPVIGFGAAQEFAARQRARSAGFAAYLPKPLPRRQLGNLLARILDGENVWQALT